MVKMWEKRLKDYTVGEGCHTATELFADIDRHLQDFSDVSQMSYSLFSLFVW